MFNRNYRAWDGHNKVMKYYTFKQLVNEDRFNYDTEVEPIESDFDKWVWMQGSNWKDRTNTEIYEGDICQLLNDLGQTITFVCKFGFMLRHSVLDCIVETNGFYFNSFMGDKPTHPIIHNYLGIHDTKIMVIIGNMYEHPHLKKLNYIT